MPDTFATPEDYFAFKGEQVPANFDAPARLLMEAGLARATDAVRARVRLARVRYAADGFPAAQGPRDAFVRATCAQFDHFEDTQDYTGSASQYDSISAAGVSLARRATSTGTTPGQSRLAPEAALILRNAGLYTTAVAH